jgi:hypothetical protein
VERDDQIFGGALGFVAILRGQKMTKETGGPAFPIVQDACPGVHSGGVESWGLTMRDYFAGQAMSGCLPGSAFSTGELQMKAQWAYRMADAMIEARK